MTYTLLTKNNLIQGISKWKKEHGSWDSDFHNCLYSELYTMRSNGFTEEYWSFLVDKLAVWRATRGSTKLEIYQRGLTRLSALGHYSGSIIKKHTGYEPDMTMVNWGEIQPLFAIASPNYIPLNSSPV